MSLFLVVLFSFNMASSQCVGGGAGALTAAEDVRMDTGADGDDNPWQAAEFISAVHATAVAINDTNIMKATVSLEAVLADDPRTLRQLAIMWLLSRREMTHEDRVRYVAVLEPTGSGKTKHILYAAHLCNTLFPSATGFKSKTVVVGPLQRYAASYLPYIFCPFLSHLPFSNPTFFGNCLLGLDIKFFLCHYKPQLG